MKEIKNTGYNFIMTDSFISSYLDIKVIDSRLCSKGIYFTDENGGLGSIKQFELDNHKYYKLEYEGENYLTLTEKEFMVIKPFKAKDYTDFLHRLDILKRFHKTYSKDKSIKEEIKAFYKDLMYFYQDMFYNGHFTEVNPLDIKSSMHIKFNKPELFDKLEEVFIKKDVDGNVVVFGYSLN